MRAWAVAPEGALWGRAPLGTGSVTPSEIFQKEAAVANDLILIVDADARSRGVLEASLKKSGYALQIFERGRDALAWLEEGHLPNLIISDTALAGMSGFEFCARVKENLDWEALPFLFLTEADSAEDKKRGFALGVEDYLTRPIYVKEITTRVQLLLQRREKDLLAFAGAEEARGDLRDVTLLDLLQTLEQHSRTGVVELEHGERRGVVYCREGRVVDAAVGKLRGAPAVYRLMQWAEGAFVVRYLEAVRRRDAVGVPTRDLVIEGMREMQRWEAVSARLALHRVFEVNYRKLADHLRDLPDEVNAVIRLFDGYRTLLDVVDDSALAPSDTVQVIEKLQEQELIRDITPEEGAEDHNLALALGDQRESLNDWLGTEAAETVGARQARRPEAETEAEKVHRRREERKRRKGDARRRATAEEPAAAPRVASSPDRPARRLHAHPDEAPASAAPALASAAPASADPEADKLRAELEALEARAGELRRQTQELAAQREPQPAADSGPLLTAGLVTGGLAVAASAESLRLRARLDEAREEAQRLEAEREAMANQIEADRLKAEEAARRKAEEDARLQAEVEAQRAAAEEQARQGAHDRALAEERRLEAMRLELEAAARQAREETARLTAEREAIKAQAEQRARDDAEAEARARLQEEEARLASARRELDAARLAAQAEADRLEQERTSPPPTVILAAPAALAAQADAPAEAPVEAAPPAMISPAEIIPAAPRPPVAPEDAFFNQPEDPAPYFEPAPPPSGGNMKLIVGFLVVIGVIIALAVYFNQAKDPKQPTPPVAEQPDAAKTDDKVAEADAAQPDAALAPDAQAAEADAADAEAVAEATPEQLQAARGRASELIFGTTMAQLAFHPETGEPMINAGDADAPAVDLDKAAPPAPKEPGVADNTPKEPKNGADKPPKEPREPAVTPDPTPAPPKENVQISDANQKKEFQRLLASGQKLARARQFDKAIEDLRQAEVIQGSSVQVNYWLGYCHYNKGNFSKAVGYLERVTRVNGNNADAVQMLGDSYRVTGQHGKAVDAYKKYLALRPTGKTSDEIRRIIGQNH